MLINLFITYDIGYRIETMHHFLSFFLLTVIFSDIIISPCCWSAPQLRCALSIYLPFGKKTIYKHHSTFLVKRKIRVPPQLLFF